MKSYWSTKLLLKQKKSKKNYLWLGIVGVLLAINVYLFAIRDLPLPQTNVVKSSTTSTPKSVEETTSFQHFTSSLGEMRKLGLHTLDNPSRFYHCSRRFDFEKTRGVIVAHTYEQWCEPRKGKIKRGETFQTSLTHHGLTNTQAFSLVEALRGKLDFRHCKPGDWFELLLSPKGEVQRFFYHTSPLVFYRVVRREDGELSAERIEHEADVVLESIVVQIKDSLYSSLERAGESDALVAMLVDIFAWDIDFYIDPRVDDCVRLIVEKVKLNNEFIRYGRILAAEYNGNKVGKHLAFWYVSPCGKSGYYDEQGKSLRKAFLKSPLKFSRIASRFGMRVHPILGFSKMHLGIDFAAPIGTPVWAVADGTVMFAGHKGANGNLIILRHVNGYETVYAHLHRFSRGIHRGTRVKQKQVIASVGNTGRSTGPHLHYGMKRHNRHINPLKQTFPPADPVPKNERTAYLNTITPLLNKLKAIPTHSNQK